MNPQRSTRPFVRLLLLALVAWGGASLRAGSGTVVGGGPETGTGTTDLIRSRLPPPPPPPPTTKTTTTTIDPPTTPSTS